MYMHLFFSFDNRVIDQIFFGGKTYFIRKMGILEHNQVSET